MHDESLLQRRLTLLREAMRPVWLKVSAQLDMPIRHTLAAPGKADLVAHHLGEVRDWLGDLIETLVDPVAALKKRELPSSGEVKLPLTLRLTAAAQLAKLSRWTTRQQVSPPVTEYQPPPISGLRYWGTLGTILIAWGIGGALFGGNDCDCG
ncbi:MAG: hypothetical protein IPN75_12680 [Dechloromonas sp.]|uniref:Uncharacterized protein n=1 Tax=Candidatus Dechloromonas phosphorivorans TaxID=2899244 RepID=A0A9D7QLX5_9RHOO|nr:hypothetical protein [Candidatus Dechloromonas phosphorivorans]